MHTLIYISYMSACYTQLSAISHLYECLFGRTRGVSKNRPDSISDVQAYTIHTLSYSTADSTADSPAQVQDSATRNSGFFLVDVVILHTV